MKDLIIYTDGGCDPNPGPGGWAALIIEDGKRREIYGAEPHSTNNRMELTAAIEALKSIKTPARVTIFTDSQYLQRASVIGCQNGWQKTGAAPMDLLPTRICGKSCSPSAASIMLSGTGCVDTRGVRKTNEWIIYAVSPGKNL